MNISLMKSAVFGLALGFSGAGLCDSSGFYVGGSIGSASTDATGYDDAGSYKAFAGFKAGQFSVEAGYVDLGKFDAKGTGNSRISVDGIQVGAVGELFINEGLDAYASAGFFSWNLDQTGASTSSDDGTSLTFGAGAKVKMSPNLGVRIGWERMNDISGSDFDLVSLGAVYRF